MAYFKFSLSFVAIYLGVLIFIVRAVDWRPVEQIVFVGGLFVFGSAAVLTFFYRNKILIEHYSERQDFRILLKILFGIHNRKKEGESDA